MTPSWAPSGPPRGHRSPSSSAAESPSRTVSDWPASAPNANPFRHIEAMITREHPDRQYPGGPLGEPIDLESALKIVTLNGAYAMQHDDVTGSIEVGKYADMIVLDHDPFALVDAGKTKEIGDITVRRTVFEGDVVYARE